MKIDASFRDLWTQTGDVWAFDLPQGWMQGRSVFGGLSAAAMAALGRRLVPDPERRLRSASIQLMAPAVSGGIEATASILREGRNISFVEVRLFQADVLVARTTLVFSRALESTLDVRPPPPPSVPGPEGLPALPFTLGLMPEFTQHVDMRWAEGSPPFMGSSEAAFTGLFRYRVPLGDVEGLLALLDTWPAPTLSLAKAPCPASTVTWTAHLLEIPSTFEDWFTMRYETTVGAHGLHTVQGRLYDRAGTMVGWSEQLVAVFG